MNSILYEKKHANIFILYISVLSAARFPSQRILLIIPFHSFNLIKMRLFFCTNVHFSFGKFNPQLKSTTTTEKGKRRKKTYFLLIVEFMKSRSSKESDKLQFFFNSETLGMNWKKCSKREEIGTFIRQFFTIVNSIRVEEYVEFFKGRKKFFIYAVIFKGNPEINESCCRTFHIKIHVILKTKAF